jgi:excinuclease UvrABC nuclease subunit
VLTERVEFVPERDAEIFAAVPAAPAVFLFRGSDARAEPYVSKTANLRRRLQRLLSAPTEHSKKLNLRERVRWIEYSATGSEFESAFLLYRLLRAEFQNTYAKRLRLRFAPLVKIHAENPYPRMSVTTRLGRDLTKYYGPFLSRVAAEKFMNDSLDFFKMRRCVDDLNPDPKFPGCIYSEMKMCLAPCFKGCTDEEYASEVARVETYFESGGDSLVREISAQREAASANLEFENAASHHARFEKLAPVVGSLPEIVRRLDQLRALIVQTSALPESVSLFRLDAGCVAGPVTFSISAPDHTKTQSMEARVDEALKGLPAAVARNTLEAMEHLSILKRWYYRSSRGGEIFISDRKGVPPMRRVVRGISRVYRGEKEVMN